MSDDDDLVREVEGNIATAPTTLQNSTPFELYRKSTLGICLSDALDELIVNNNLPQEVANKVLTHFDKAVNKSLETQVKNKVTFKGHLHTYRFCDNVWTLILENAVFKTETEVISCDKVKIVACDGNCMEC